MEACFLEAAEDTWRMEAELARAVLVTVTGTRPTVDVTSAAEALHAEFGIGPADMSIRSFYPEDFLVLCQDGAVRDRMVRAGRASSSWFELTLRPWIRQAQATAASLPYLVPISLRGMPAHAWSQRTASVILRGLGYIMCVDDSTARRLDMADFRLWLRMDRPRQIPRRRLLFIDEPRRTLWAEAEGQQTSVGRRPSTLWYPIEITVLAEPTMVDRDGADARPPPPPPPQPSPPTGDDDLAPGPGVGRARRGDTHGNGGSGGNSTSTVGSSTAAPPPARNAPIQNALDPEGAHVSSSCVAAVTGSLFEGGPGPVVGAMTGQPIACWLGRMLIKKVRRVPAVMVHRWRLVRLRS